AGGGSAIRATRAGLPTRGTWCGCSARTPARPSARHQARHAAGPRAHGGPGPVRPRFPGLLVRRVRVQGVSVRDLLAMPPAARDHGGMADPVLTRQAEAAGIAPSYADWRGQRVEVSDETLTAILAALDSVPGGAAEAAGNGSARVNGRPGPEGPGARAMPRVPAGRARGFRVPLSPARPRRSRGPGDLGDLADLAGWSARELGAGFVLITPLPAAEPLPPVSPSPYLPMTRRYVSPLYLRI